MAKKLEPTRVTIGDYEFAIYPFSAMTSARVGGDLLKFITPLIGGIAPLFKNGTDGEEAFNSLASMSTEELSQVIMMLSSSFDGTKIEALLQELLFSYKNISVEYRNEKGKAVQAILTEDLADELFIGQLQDMIILAIHVAKVNFASFFTGSSAQFGGLLNRMTGQKSTTTGSSTEDVTLI